MAAIGAVLAFGVMAIRGETGGLAFGALASALLFLPFPQFPGNMLFPINGPRWSLFTELLANFLHATGFARISTGYLTILAGCMFALLVAASVQLGDWPLPLYSDSFWSGLLRMLTSYVIGILLWRHFKGRHVVRINLPALCTILAIAVYYGGLINPVIFEPLFVLIISPLLVLGGASCTISPRMAGWAAASGAISYPLYAVHSPLIGLSMLSGLGPWSLLGIALLTVILVMAIIAARFRAAKAAAFCAVPRMS